MHPRREGKASGSRGASLLPGPLRTVHASCPAHGSSKPLTQLPARRPMGCGVNLLVAVEVDKIAVGPSVAPTLGARFDVVVVELFVIEERVPTDRADIALFLG